MKTSEPPDWYEVKRRLLRTSRSADDILDMTLPEIILTLDEGDDSGVPRGASDVGEGAGRRQWERLRSMTPRQKLEAMREGTL